MLDNLRLRLRQLPENHPSAVRAGDGTRDEAPRPRSAGDGERIQAPAPAEASEPDDQPLDDSPAGDPAPDDPPAADQDSEGRAGDDADAAAPRGGSLPDLIRALKDAGAGTSVLGEMDLFTGTGSGDPYRPWFMSGEPGAPWFAEGEDM